MTNNPTSDSPLTVSAIEAALAERGVSVSELCRRSDVAFSTWHRWKVGGRRPHRGTWARVMRAYGELVDPPAEVVA